MTLVVFDIDEMAIIERETRERARAVDVVGLGMDVSGGTSSRLERQKIGVMGEAALLKMLGRSVDGVLTHGKLDGGVDLIVRDAARRELKMQVKATLTPRPRWIYSNPVGRFRCDLMSLVAARGAHSVDVVGWHWFDHFKRYAEMIDVGGRQYLGMKAERLLPVDWLLRMAGQPM